MSVRIEQATERDRATVLRLHQALYRDHHGQIVPPQVAELGAYRDLERVLREDISALLQRHDARVLVARRGRTVLGYVTATLKHDPRRKLARRAVIEDWYVVPDERGKGTGKALMHHILERLEAEGVEVVESSTVASNHASRAAHARLGFAETDVKMRRRLGK